MKLYGIYDTVACDYVGFFNAKNDEVAKRGLTSLEKNDPRCSADFYLYRLGDLNGENLCCDLHVIGSIPSIVGVSDNE